MKVSNLPRARQEAVWGEARQTRPAWLQTHTLSHHLLLSPDAGGRRQGHGRQGKLWQGDGRWWEAKHSCPHWRSQLRVGGLVFERETMEGQPV